MRDRVTAIVGVALLAALVGATYMYSIQQYLAGLKYVPSPESPDFSAREITLTDYNADGSAKHRLFAREMEHFTDNRVKAEGVDYATLNPNLAKLAIHADKAWSNDGLRSLELMGGVKLDRSAFGKDLPFHFQTDYLKGYLDTYTFDTNKPVRLQWGIDTTESRRGLHYDHIARSVELNGGVTTVIRSKTAQKAGQAK